MTGKSKAEAGLLQAVRDMKAGRAARVFVPDGKGGMVRSEVARARMASGLTQQKFASLLGVSASLAGMGAGAQESFGCGAHAVENCRHQSEGVACGGG
jgi:hypothetical protein